MLENEIEKKESEIIIKILINVMVFEIIIIIKIFETKVKRSNFSLLFVLGRKKS